MPLPKNIAAALASLLPLLFSCSANNTNELKRLFQLQANAEVSTKTIQYQTEMIYRSLKEKTKMPESAEKAAIWNNKAERTADETKKLFIYIDSIKTGLQQEAGIDNFDYETVYSKKITRLLNHFL